MSVAARVAMMLSLLIASALSLAAQDPEEAARRDRFTKDGKDKSAQKRADAVWRMSGSTEEKSIALLVPVFKDTAIEVRKALAGVLAECTDGLGVTVRPLCGWLLNKKDEPALRLACARALAKAEYRAEAIDALIQTIGGIGEQEKELYPFGADCTKLLGDVAGQDFGATKETPDKWKKWWKENQAKLTKEDAEKLAAYKKSPQGTGDDPDHY